MTLLYRSMLVLYHEKLLGISVSLFVGRPPCFDIEKVQLVINNKNNTVPTPMLMYAIVLYKNGYWFTLYV